MHSSQLSILWLCFYSNHYANHTKFIHRPKHPVKVHVWAGFSLRGQTGICIPEGTMDAALHINIPRQTLLPVLCQINPAGHRLMQDNDPKHTSRCAVEFFKEEEVNWWRTPQESLDMNPIGNLWHEMKEYLRREVKPPTKQELVQGIRDSWETVCMVKCTRYIRHLRKVLPRVIAEQGGPTGY